MQMCLYIFFMTQRDFAQFARLLLCQHLQAVYMYTNMMLASVFFPYVFLSHPPSLSLSLSIFLSLSLSLSLSCSLSLSLSIYASIYSSIYLSIYTLLPVISAQIRDFSVVFPQITVHSHTSTSHVHQRVLPIHASINLYTATHSQVINQSKVSVSNVHRYIYSFIYSHTTFSHQSVTHMNKSWISHIHKQFLPSIYLSICANFRAITTGQIFFTRTCCRSRDESNWNSLMVVTRCLLLTLLWVNSG